MDQGFAQAKGAEQQMKKKKKKSGKKGTQRQGEAVQQSLPETVAKAVQESINSQVHFEPLPCASGMTQSWAAMSVRCTCNALEFDVTCGAMC